ncbi:MAG: phosphoribosylformylglycinamidine cyclo-ligase [Clostridium sp.]|jgi:phosphoribosylformylglycinamidine cyclo-ligase|nr:phosphoribosylformylglycinamidine cyclo-ligase [Clostridium sp.]
MAEYEVNIDLANDAKKEMAKKIGSGEPRVLNQFGAFSSLYDFSFPEYKQPVLVLKTEEPGSKQLLAMKYGKIETVCYDMIHHLINDCIVMGARPLTVQDAIICGKLEKDIVTKIVASISDACRKQGCVLTGGETSEQPGVLEKGVYILTSSIVGIVEKEKIIDGSKIEAGDLVLSLESSGIHTNGYTLVRKIIAENPMMEKEIVDGRDLIAAVLEPHRCYYSALKGLFGKDVVQGMAHITGGGIRENLNRILPDNVNAEIDLAAYQVPTIFHVLKKYGAVSDEEMLRTFNLGVGLAMAVKRRDADEVISAVERNGVSCHIIGKMVPGNGSVVCKNKLRWE